MASNLKDIYVGVNKADEDRRGYDLYETPPLATYILTKYATPPKNLVEPCAGRGNIAIELIRQGHDVKCYDLNDHPNKVWSDIKTGQDVLSLEKLDGVDGLVTNPPYFQDLPRKIVEKSVAEYDYTALFVRLTFLEGIKRKKLFTNNSPSDIIILSDRVRFSPNLTKEPIDKKEQIGGMIAYCWVVFNKKANHQNTKLTWVTLSEEYDEWYDSYLKSPYK